MIKFPIEFERKQGEEAPSGTVKDRTWRGNGANVYTGPSYSTKRGNGPTVNATKDVRRFGVSPAHRWGE